MSRERLYQLLEAHGFQRVHAETRPGRSVRSFPAHRLPLSEPVRRFLRQVAPAGLYGHQLEALSRHLDGADVGLTTRTASGKSLVFYAAALEAVARNPRARILAIYPLKALGREQEARWVAAFRAAGWPEERVARIDGDVGHAGERMQRLRRASVLLATPDILHAWLLPHVGERPVWEFIRALRLVVVDEVHVYSGVFGSNAAFLFRRLEHLLALAGGRASYVVASATLREPLQHFQALFGRSFTLVDESFDTSGQHELELLLVRPPGTQELLSSVSAFLRDLVRHTEYRFIAFVDSRKQTELLATIVKRAGGEGGARAGAEGTAAAVPAPADPVPEEPEEEPLPGIAEDLARLHVLPYRAGLEEEDRAVIQDRLSAGTLRGIISTSALELGVDIPHLDLGILLGVPRSTTSLQQRMGRVGRHGPGTVVVINNGDLYSEMIFKQPDRILRLPLAEGALYLENQRIQYIHAMCLARPGGEHDQARAQAGLPETDAFDSPVNWPDGFVELCRRERAGETPPGLQHMKMEAGDTPHTTFPLRDVDSQFRIQLVQGWEREELGS
ncbi:MAG TPA: DEAD/DEAH box helicase, partial [Thermaerobacter sp.]